MSWIIGYFYEQKAYTPKLVAELRPLSDEDEIVDSCRCGTKINGCINRILSPIFVYLRTIADCEMRESPDLAELPGSVNYYVTRNPDVMKEVLKYHRSDSSPDGIFDTTPLGQGITDVANRIFSPEKPIVARDNILACDKNEHTNYSKFLNQFFNPKSIKAHLSNIEAIIDDHLNQFEKKDQEFVINEHIKFLATNVMASVFLGIKKSFTISSAISNIIPWITEESARKISSFYNFCANHIKKLRFISDEDKNYTKKVLSEVIQAAITEAREGRGNAYAFTG